jgi:hypothetical protein
MNRQALTLEAATDLFKQFLARQGAPTDNPYFDLVRGYDWRLGAGLFADEARVSVQAMPASFSTEKDVEVAFQVKLNWSSTHRTVAQATAAVATYREAVDFAARCEAFFQELGRVVLPAKTETPVK